MEAAALRKTKKDWEACGAVVTSLCTSITKAMDDIDLRVQKVIGPYKSNARLSVRCSIEPPSVFQGSKECFRRANDCVHDASG